MHLGLHPKTLHGGLGKVGGLGRLDMIGENSNWIKQLGLQQRTALYGKVLLFFFEVRDFPSKFGEQFSFNLNLNALAEKGQIRVLTIKRYVNHIIHVYLLTLVLFLFRQCFHVSYEIVLAKTITFLHVIQYYLLFIPHHRILLKTYGQALDPKREFKCEIPKMRQMMGFPSFVSLSSGRSYFMRLSNLKSYDYFGSFLLVWMLICKICSIFQKLVSFHSQSSLLAFANIIFNSKKMRSKNERISDVQFSILTPWEVEIDDAPFTRYCSDLIEGSECQPTEKIRKKMPNPPIKRRAISNCNNPKNQNHPPAIEKSKYNKTHQQFINQNNQNRALMTLTQNRTERQEKRREIAERGVLQELKELSVKNFVIEGQQKNNTKEKGKKRESSYILKQKFNEFRRSMKSIAHFKENYNMKVVRYE